MILTTVDFIFLVDLFVRNKLFKSVIEKKEKNLKKKKKRFQLQSKDQMYKLKRKKKSRNFANKNTLKSYEPQQ